MKVSLVGVGSGERWTLTFAAHDALMKADIIIGARRLIDTLSDEYAGRRVASVSAAETAKIITESGCNSAVAVFSGDSGFYSGARLLLPLLKAQGVEAEVIAGISSVQLLAAKLGRPWQDWRLVSAHGVTCDPIFEMTRGGSVLFLTGGAVTPSSICGELTAAGLGDTVVTVGDSLGGDNERIVTDTANNIQNMTFSPLNILLCDSAARVEKRASGWEDGEFIRGKTPMTKRFVRAAVMSCLNVASGDICWDVGAGTGSVSVEMAALSRHVWSVERDSDACELIEQNRSKFRAWNVTVVRGSAPDCLNRLPDPNAVFIGGSGGKMDEIIDTVFARNPAARVCATAIAIETVTRAADALSRHGIEPEIVQIGVSQSKKAGNLHIMTANNPVWLIFGSKNE